MPILPRARARPALTIFAVLAVVAVVAVSWSLGARGPAPATTSPVERTTSLLPTSSLQPTGSLRPTGSVQPTGTPGGGPGRRPNIVVLMLDDVPPVNELFDRMPVAGPFFAAGVRFDRYFGNDPLCCPGRAAFLTGQYTHHHGVILNDARLMDPSMTIATRLQESGYHTIIAGKYLNGFTTLDDLTPVGWDRTAILGQGAYRDYDLYRDGLAEHHARAETDYSTDVIADAAIDMLEGAPDKPTFLLLTPIAVHADPSAPPMPLPAERHRDDPRCRDIGVRRGAAYNEADMSDKPRFLAERRRVPFKNGWPLVLPCETLLSVDEMLARVIAHFTGTDTLFVLTADNGMAWGDHRWPAKSVPFSTAIPLAVRWPGHDAGPRTSLHSISNVDLAPTLAAIAGTTMGSYPNGQPGPDGLDVSSLLVDPAATLDRPAILEQHDEVPGFTPGWHAIRTTDAHPLGVWHYIEWKDGSVELYDLRNDPAELRNRRGARFAATRQRLADELHVMVRAVCGSCADGP